MAKSIVTQGEGCVLPSQLQRSWQKGFRERMQAVPRAAWRCVGIDIGKYEHVAVIQDGDGTLLAETPYPAGRYWQTNKLDRVIGAAPVTRCEIQLNKALACKKSHFERFIVTKHPILFSLLVLALLGLVLSACGGQAQPTSTPTHTPKPPAATPAATSAAVADAWQRVQSSGRMVVAVSADYPPFESYDENFKLDGFDIALMKTIGQRLGVEVEFSDVYFISHGVALRSDQAQLPAIESVEDLRGLRVAVEGGAITWALMALGIKIGNELLRAVINTVLGAVVLLICGQAHRAPCRNPMALPVLQNQL